MTVGGGGHVRLARLFGAVAVTTLLLAGCWTQIGYGPEHRYFNSAESGLTLANVETLTETWSIVADGQVTEPMVSGNRVYVVHATSFPEFSGASVLAADASDGSTLWDTSIFPVGGRFQIRPVPAILVGDEIWSGFDSNTVLAPPACPAGAVRVDDQGTIVQDSPGVRVSPAVTASGVVVRITEDASSGACSGNQMLFVQDAATTTPRWWADLPLDSGLVTPTIVGDTIYVVIANTTLQAYPVAGCASSPCSPAWSVDFGTSIGSSGVVGGFDGQLFVIAGTAGAPGDLVAVDGATGTELWRSSLEATSGRIATTNEAVYVTTNGSGTSTNSLIVYNASGCGSATCTPAWLAPLGAEAFHPPVVAGGVVYAGAASTVHAFDANGCGATTCTDPLISLSVTGSISGLSVAQGKLFVASTDHLTAFAPT